MKLRFTFLAAAVLSLVLASSAAAQVAAPFTVVDRRAVTLTYLPTGGGNSVFAASVSYSFGPTWDLLVGYSSDSAPAGSGLRIGGRFHMRPPARGIDPYVTLQYSSETVGAASTTAFLVGGGISAQVAPRLDLFGSLNYHSDDQVIYYDYGVQYQVSPQFSIVGGINSALAYLGVSMSFR